MLRDTRAALDHLGFKVSAGLGQAGGYVIERAFVER
jgi:ferredoxin--NADP+ reductase